MYSGNQVMILVLAGLPYLTISTWIADTFPKNDMEEDRILTKDRESGCSVSLYLERSELYVFNDSCVTMPKSTLYHAKSLRLRKSKITVIEAGDFDKWPSITSLVIEMNSVLLEIEPGAFRSLKNLKSLSINYNLNLRSIKPDLFDGLVNVEEFHFIKNNFHELSGLVLALNRLPALKILNLSHNPVVTIRTGDYSLLNASKIEELYLNLCGLADLDSDSFGPLTNLKILDLKTNSLTSDQLADISLNLSKTAKNLTYLSVSDNLLDRNPSVLFQAISQTNISKLNLSDNHFNLLQANLFPIMPNIKTLDISGLRAIYLDNTTFNSYYLPNLTKLSAARNRFPAILQEFLLPTLIELDISENSCEELGGNQFENMKNLKRLNLAKNSLFNIHQKAFSGLSNLEFLNLSSCKIYDLPDYPFWNLTNLIELDLSYNNFLRDGSLTNKKFAGLKSLKILKLNNCDIKSLNDPDLFKSLVNLEYLTLRGNKVSELNNPYWLLSLVNLVELDLAYNGMNEWNSRLLLNNTELRVLSLFSNRIKYITVSMLEDFSTLDYLDISENHLYCTCNTVMNVQNYIINNNKTLDNYSLNKTNGECYKPITMEHTTVAFFIKEQIEGGRCKTTLDSGSDNTSLDSNRTRLVSNSNKTLPVILCILIPICLLCTGALFAYYLRFHIRYWIFLLRQTIRFKFLNTNATDRKYKYDAFVSYSHEDRSFVIRLVSMLESQPPYYKLCVFERDFSVGDIITESVLDCLSASRRTILVISDSFARSTWCLWEMHLAQHKRLFFKDENNQPLVIVKIGEIIDKHMTPTLRYLIKTRIYLQWDADSKKQKIFWEKLRKSLAPPKM